MTEEEYTLKAGSGAMTRVGAALANRQGLEDIKEMARQLEQEQGPELS